MNAPQPLELNGTIISSDQQMFGNLIFFGNLAILVQNQSGYYPYLITTNKQEYLIELVGNPIPNNVICYQINFQNQTILTVACLNLQQNQAIIYEYDLFNYSFLQPTLYTADISLQNITNSVITQIQYEFAFTSSITNYTEILSIWATGSQSYEQLGYLTDMIGNEYYLYIDLLQCGFSYFTFFQHRPSMFLKMAVLYLNRQQVLIATQDSILIVDYIKHQSRIILRHQIHYLDGFVLNQNSKVSLFVDDQYIIVSDSLTLLIYEQSNNNNRLFWVKQLQQQSSLQYDSLNKIITIINSQSIYAFQLFKPQIQLYFNQISSGTLYINLQGLNGNCSHQLEYQVIQNNDTGPFVNYNNQTQELNFQESQIQCVNCLFTGLNLTYNQYSANINISSQYFQDNFFLNNIKIQFFYLFENPLNPQQYAIFYQIENSYNMYVIYCGLPYCYYASNYETQNQIVIFTTNGQINSFKLQQYQYLSGEDYMFELGYTITNEFHSYYLCAFQWQYEDNFQCNKQNIQNTQLPPKYTLQVGAIQFFTYFLTSDPYFLIMETDFFRYQQIQSNYQFVPRQVYYSSLLYNSLVFIDNIYQLSVYELILNGTYLNYITSIQYPIQQGNTSVGIGLLEEAIIITQIDDQGNQFIQVYNPNVIRQINLIQQQLPQIVQIPTGAKIQFPVISSYSISKFYLAWQYNENYEIAVIQPSNTINNMILSSIYVDGSINQIQAISQEIYDILVCQYNQNQIRQITVYNQFYIKLSSNLLLQNDTFENVTINYQAQSKYGQVQVTNQYTFINQIFNITLIQNQSQLQLAYTPWFRLFLSDYYYGLVNTYENINNQVNPAGPFFVSKNFISVNASPLLFLSNQSLQNGFNLYFQNNQGVYLINNYYYGQIQQITSFENNLRCPVMYQNENYEITSICQSSPTQLIMYSSTVQNFTLDQPLNLVNGVYQFQTLVLNYGHMVQVIVDNYIICEYINYQINITNMFILYTHNLRLLLQVENSEIIIILDYWIGQELACGNYNQRQIWIDRNQYGSILYLDSQNDLNLLTVTTTKMSIIYQLGFYTIEGRYFVSYSPEMVGIKTKIINNYIIAIYNTTSENQLNYTIIMYGLSTVDKVDFPIISYYNQFNGSPQQFYICQDGTVVYTYTYQNQTGFSYIQVIPYVYVAIDFNNLTQISQNDTYSINNYITEFIIGNQFNQANITFNITYTNYIGSAYHMSAWSEMSLILMLISALSIFGFCLFAANKIQTRSKWK